MSSSDPNTTAKGQRKEQGQANLKLSQPTDDGMENESKTTLLKDAPAEMPSETRPSRFGGVEQTPSMYFTESKRALSSRSSNFDESDESSSMYVQAPTKNRKSNIKKSLHMSDLFHFKASAIAKQTHQQKSSSSFWDGSNLSSGSFHNTLNELLDTFVKDASQIGGGLSEWNEEDKFKRWVRSFRHLDPRYGILAFFNAVAQSGCHDVEETGVVESRSSSYLLDIFDNASVFTVWRPTSIDAIRKIMEGEGVGKGLDIKGKSAKKGKLSGFVPFLQIHEEEHKKMVRTLPKDARMRIFYRTRGARDEAVETLEPVAKDMKNGFEEACSTLSGTTTLLRDSKFFPALEKINEEDEDEVKEEAMSRFMWEMGDNANIALIDDYAPDCFGIELLERLFWEGYVMRQTIARPKNSDLHTGRPSEPAFQDMNFGALRKVMENSPRPVVWQHSSEDPMCPRQLLMAYEEHGRVLPVVSDFDCFLVGTRGVKYSTPLPEEQVDMMKWSVSQMKEILNSDPSADSWTVRWLDVLKRAAANGIHPKMPKYGYGDPKSYSIMENAVASLEKGGSVRHGAECFNFYFPQELDDEFLVISNYLPGKIPWMYVNQQELCALLSEKADLGFTFPLNPKWVLCDPGLKLVYDKLLASQKSDVQNSMDVWFPRQSGIREMIEDVHARHPCGFQRRKGRVHRRQGYSPLRESIHANHKLEGTEALDLALLELKHEEALQRAKKKLRAVLVLIRLHKEVSKRRLECEEKTAEEVNTS